MKSLIRKVKWVLTELVQQWMSQLDVDEWVFQTVGWASSFKEPFSQHWKTLGLDLLALLDPQRDSQQPTVLCRDTAVTRPPGPQRKHVTSVLQIAHRCLCDVMKPVVYGVGVTIFRFVLDSNER